MSSSSSASSHTSSCSPSSGSLASSLDDRLNVHPRDALAVAAAAAAAAAVNRDVPTGAHVVTLPAQQYSQVQSQQQQPSHPVEVQSGVPHPPYHLPIVPICASAPYTELVQLTQLSGSSEDALFAHANYARRPPNPFSFDLTPPPPPATTPYSPPLPLVFSPSSATAGGRSFAAEETSKPTLAQHPLTTYLSSLQPSKPVVRFGHDRLPASHSANAVLHAC